MQKRGLILLAAATVALVVLAIVALATGDRGVSRAAPGERAFPALAAKLGEVASVAITRNGFDLTLIRDGDSWLVAEKGNYPANAGKISQIVLAMADLALVEPKTQKADLYPRLDVEEPGNGQIDPGVGQGQIGRDPRRGDRRQAALRSARRRQ